MYGRHDYSHPCGAVFDEGLEFEAFMDDVLVNSFRTPQEVYAGLDVKYVKLSTY